MKVAAVIPARNEASVLASVVEKTLGQVCSVVVVDDASEDETGAVARAAGATVLRHALPRGAGRATATGLRAALLLGADLLVTLDGDGQHDPSEIPKLLEPLQDGSADLVVGCRLLEREAMPRIRRLGNGVANLMTRILYGVSVSDSQSGFRAWRRSAVEAVPMESCGYEFCSASLGAARQAGQRIVEVPITTVYSDYSLAKGQSVSRAVGTLFEIGRASLK